MQVLHYMAICIPKVHSEPCQKSKMEAFIIKFNGWKSLIFSQVLNRLLRIVYNMYNLDKQTYV